MVVYYTEVALLHIFIVLNLDPVLYGTEVVAQVDEAARLDARKDSLFS